MNYFTIWIPCDMKKVFQLFFGLTFPFFIFLNFFLIANNEIYVFFTNNGEVNF